MPLVNRPVVRVGICAMNKKAKSKAMREILTRLEKYGEFEIIIFGDECILQQPIEEWPIVDALISFFSDGFPLAKAQSYATLREPFVVNDLETQWDLLDRRVVYKTLQDNDIPVPPHIVVNRNDPVTRGVMPSHDAVREAPHFVEAEDYVENDGVRVSKPFVEKPANAENHNICIYYPHTVGGGYKALFRKIGNQASKYYPAPPPGDNNRPYSLVRRDQSFIYEDFMSTGGTDVKVYTVGPNYAHAEARKSPVVDGRVQRDANGKEERFPVLLTPDEKEIARRVCLAFGQMVCGFDLLRTKGRSYVCDVNGWSFVKNSTKYFDDAALCLRAMILQAVAPHHSKTIAAERAAAATTGEAEEAASLLGGDRDDVGTPGNNKKGEKHKGKKEELRAVLAVIRHGDRTPKQKMKMRVKDQPLLDLLARCTHGRARKQAKLKTPQRLQELLNICRELYATRLTEGPKKDDAEEGGKRARGLGRRGGSVEAGGVHLARGRALQRDQPQGAAQAAVVGPDPRERARAAGAGREGGALREGHGGAPDSQIRRRADALGEEPGGVSRERFSHADVSGRELLRPRQRHRGRPSAPSQHVSTRPEDLLLGRGKSADHRRGVRERFTRPRDAGRPAHAYSRVAREQRREALRLRHARGRGGYPSREAEAVQHHDRGERRSEREDREGKGVQHVGHGAERRLRTLRPRRLRREQDQAGDVPDADPVAAARVVAATTVHGRLDQPQRAGRRQERRGDGRDAPRRGSREVSAVRAPSGDECGGE